jgi:predicted porin
MTKIRLNHLFVLIICISSPAVADPLLYGRLVTSLEGDYYHSPGQINMLGVVDDMSYFGIKGSEAITSQTNFIWQVEQFISLTVGQGYAVTTGDGLIVPRDNTSDGRVMQSVNQLGSSDTYLGIQSNWGSIKLGNLSTYMRSQMVDVDFFNYNTGANGLSVFSRTSDSMVLPNSFAYNSTSWHGFTIGATYSFNNITNVGASANNNLPMFGSGQNGNYSGGVYSYGVAWTDDRFKVNFGGVLWPTVGSYNHVIAGVNQATTPSAAEYSNAYANRLELSYNDPDGLFVGTGVQVASGLGWYNWANSGGAFNNYITNPGFNYAGLDAAEYQTQEFAVSAGYHFGTFVPQVAYSYGNNMMYGGSIGSILSGTANQIPNSGYQQLVAELDMIITPRAFVFVNYGQVWYGNTLHNVSYCGLNCNNGSSVGAVADGEQAFFDQSTFAIGLSYVF